jgi:hypothetical protein
MNRDRWLMRWWDCKYALKQWLPRFSLLWFLLAAIVLGTIAEEILPYITPQKPWPDWAFLLVMGSGLLTLLVCSERKR